MSRGCCCAVIVKVCGVRTPQVAEVAVQAGADWIGLVFEPRSSRCVDDRAADAVREAVAGRAALVGVLVAGDAAQHAALVGRHRLDALQVHGDVARDVLLRAPVPVIRGLNVRSAAEVAELDWPVDCLVLLDAAPEDPSGLPGGTGRQLDLTLAAAVAVHRPIVLAGGLGPDNVAAAIATVRPVGVDASSGLESAPGVKDEAKVAAYVRAAREAARLR